MSIGYFLDECGEYEINDVLEYLPYTDRNLWETQRLNSFITAQVNSRKKLNPTDICKFKWETDLEDIEVEHVTEISNNDIERLKQLSKQWEE